MISKSTANPRQPETNKIMNQRYSKINNISKPLEENIFEHGDISAQGIELNDFPLNELFIIALIPAYNEGKSIENIVSLTSKFVDHVIVCNDGSSDKTAEIVSNMDVKLINHMKNNGKGQALRTLFSEAVKYNPDVIVTLDGDGQHDPSEIPRLVKEVYLKKSDFVIGSRFLKGSETDITRVRNFGLKSLNLFERLLFKTNITDTQSGFRAFSRKAYKIFNNAQESGYGAETEQNILARKYGLKISEVPVTIRYENLPNSSKKHFIMHGLELLTVMIRYFFRNGR